MTYKDLKDRCALEGVSVRSITNILGFSRTYIYDRSGDSIPDEVVPFIDRIFNIEKKYRDSIDCVRADIEVMQMANHHDRFLESVERDIKRWETFNESVFDYGMNVGVKIKFPDGNVWEYPY